MLTPTPTSLWLLLTPNSDSRQSQAVRSLRGISIQQRVGEIPPCIVLEDLSPALSKKSDPSQCAIKDYMTAIASTFGYEYGQPGRRLTPLNRGNVVLFHPR